MFTEKEVKVAMGNLIKKGAFGKNAKFDGEQLLIGSIPWIDFSANFLDDSLIQDIIQASDKLSKITLEADGKEVKCSVPNAFISVFEKANLMDAFALYLWHNSEKYKI